MNLALQYQQALAEERRLAELRKAAWNKDPGNTHMVHLFLTAHDYHRAWTEWARARDVLLAIERQMAAGDPQGITPANDTQREAAP